MQRLCQLCKESEKGPNYLAKIMGPAHVPRQAFYTHHLCCARQKIVGLGLYLFRTGKGLHISIP